jgi:hypothetical protein
MKKFTTFGFLFISIFAFADFGTDESVRAAASSHHRIECSSYRYDIQYGSAETKGKFDSAIPSFVEVTKATKPKEAPVTKTTTHLSPESVCGLNLDFAKKCRFREELTPRYRLLFTCGKDITEGEVICDDNCMGEGGYARLTCKGPKFPQGPYGGYRRSFWQCKFIQ